MEVAIVHGSHSLWGSAHMQHDIGGVAVVVKNSLLVNASVDWVMLAEGRAGLLRVRRRVGDARSR